MRWNQIKCLVKFLSYLKKQSMDRNLSENYLQYRKYLKTEDKFMLLL